MCIIGAVKRGESTPCRQPQCRATRVAMASMEEINGSNLVPDGRTAGPTPSPVATPSEQQLQCFYFTAKYLHCKGN